MFKFKHTIIHWLVAIKYKSMVIRECIKIYGGIIKIKRV